QPSWRWVATSMFSSTLSRKNSRVIWNVRPTPSANTRSGVARVIDSPSKRISPPLQRSYPVITLNSVVLPEPLGPIRPAIDPLATDSEQSFRAWRPPNDLDTWSASSTALTAHPPRPHHRSGPARQGQARP